MRGSQGFSEWAQARVKTMRKHERNNNSHPDPQRAVLIEARVQSHSKPQRYQTMIATTNSASFAAKCALCERNHYEVKCPTVLVASKNKCWDIFKARKVCFGCLKRGHQHRQSFLTIDGVHKIPVSQLQMSASRRIMQEMIRIPEGNYEALFVLCKDCDSKTDFGSTKLLSYK